MCKNLLLCAIFCLWLPAQGVLAATKPIQKSPAPKATFKATPVVQKESSRPQGFDFKGSIDIKMFNMTNANYGETTDWYFYPIYRAMLSYGFAPKNLWLYTDLEKPGYANVTYPFIKVNELYARFQQNTFYVKLGRQIFGDTEDLLLGLQNDAISLGFDLGTTDLLLFLAKTDLPVPWFDATNGKIGGVFGFVPHFQLNESMDLNGYLLLGTEEVTVTTPGGTEDKINSLLMLGARYKLALAVAESAQVNLNSQVGLQFGMARDLNDQSIDATGVGLKLDGEYSNQTPQLGFTIGGHIVYTSGDPDPMVATKTGFASSNALVGAGPGLFSKIEDGAGPLTYLDAHRISPKLRSYFGVLALGLTAGLSVGQFDPGIGVWIYSNTDKDGKSLGTELNEWVNFRLSEIVTFYQQAALFIPNAEGIGNPPGAPAPNNAVKLLIGSSIIF